jgi:hypothetical protein
MEHLSSDMEQEKMSKYDGEEIKCKSFAAKDTAKERYPKYCKLDTCSDYSSTYSI